jgi:hypothetical protein
MLNIYKIGCIRTASQTARDKQLLSAMYEDKLSEQTLVLLVAIELKRCAAVRMLLSSDVSRGLLGLASEKRDTHNNKRVLLC